MFAPCRLESKDLLGEVLEEQVAANLDKIRFGWKFGNYDENEFNNLKEVYTALGIMDPIHKHMHKRQRNGVIEELSSPV